MHEISLVQGLFEQLKELAAANNATRIISVTMEIGPLCGVVVDSFQFGFDILSADDELVRGAKMIIQVPPVSYRCTNCSHVEITAGRKPDACPACGELLLIPDGGSDLLLRQVEME
ncbi:hydrogenase maturation nickel metallochaperone HypA [Desulfopila sp. IMCC35006]|uniref:hydrogenase maturation nickel metallochaperone HypA/HybF n=1 Tax=Desulfopila sp. IMCC35006 TaxID=2569542 RepID=UPI0010AC4542|nr:hydrogenase maturation nickel metallochaperone HypA [Desulfopila sp. IMCC35006]TKB27136.1 hydrogenase maturation nickel metallochaperone HypA [Desulfopila sp. IMCC35006]